MNSPEIQEQNDNETINLLDIIQVIAKRSRMIIHVTGAATILSVIITLFLPNIYSSTARLLPPKQDQGLKFAMLSQMGGLGNLAGDMLGGGTTGDLYVGMLKSEAVKDAIIDRFKLMDVYKKKYRIDTYKVLDKAAIIGIGKKDGIIHITVEDKDPKRAAAVANAFVDELSKLNIGLNVSGAGRDRTFLEERLIRAKRDLAKAEEALKVYQTKNKAINVIEQAKATIEGVGQLRAELALKEVQLASLRAYITDENDEIKTVKASISSLTAQIDRLEGNSKGSSIPSVGSVPALGQEYLRLMRELKIQETILEFLTKQHEMAKLSEAKDVSSIQVLQHARVPDKQSKPKRSLLVFTVTVITLLGSVLMSFLLEYAERMPIEDREHWRLTASFIRGKRVLK